MEKEDIKRNYKTNNTIALLEHQLDHYENIKNSIVKHSRGIDASDTGTGKTYVSVKLCLELGLIPWVICPKSVVSSWTRVIKQAGIKKFYVITYDQLILSTDLIVKNESIDTYDWAFETDNKFSGNSKTKYLFIYDEAHKCKNLKTINSKIMMSLSKYPVKILLLSATIIDKPLYFVPFGIVLKLYGNITDGLNWIGKTIGSNSGVKTSRTSNPMLHIHKALFNEYASRMRIDDTVGVFKNNKIFFEGIYMKNYWEIEQKYDKINLILEQEKLNKKKREKQIKKPVKKSRGKKNNIDNDDEEIDMDSDSESEDLKNKNSNHSDILDIPDVPNEEDTEKKKNNGFGMIQKLRQDIEFLRVDTICELVLKYVTESKSVAIFVNFTKTIKELSKRLSCNCIIWGSQTLKERTKSIDDFCSDRSRIIICNIASGSAGVSLHDTLGQFPRVSIISPTWSAQDLIQVLGRIHRAMGKSDCEQHIIFCKGTIEESVGNVIKQKINNIRLFNNGEKQLKKDNMEVILNNELIKKKKKQEANQHIYKTNDFDSIQNRLDYFERQLKRVNDELSNYPENSDKYKECEYRLNKIKKELDFNIDLMNKSIENICK
jgi:superfamily II DNA or RNA helicase